MTESQDLRNKILDAAMKRFTHFGYAKTTMAEIASDCDMSAGNIYRFFKNKLDIAEAIYRKYWAQHFKDKLAIARDESLSAEERLRRVIFYSVELLFQEMHRRPNMVDLLRLIDDERIEITKDYHRREGELLSEILEAGAARGEFNLYDSADSVAKHLQLALRGFVILEVLQRSTLDDFKEQFDGIFQLLLNGIAAANASEG